MTPEDIETRLKFIRELDELELRSWWQYIHRPWARPQFDGEIAALTERANVLGVALGDVK